MGAWILILALIVPTWVGCQSFWVIGDAFTLQEK